MTGLELGPDDVHVRRISLFEPERHAARFVSFLSAEEITRMNRLVRERDRAAFAVARGSLRTWLARYTGGQPADIAFAYGPDGKPELAGAPDLKFNLSHSGAVAYLAIARRAVGIDVEAGRPVRRLDAIAGRFFSKTECRFLADLPESDKNLAFLRGWTRKEALIKAHGGALFRNLTDFEVPLSPLPTPVEIKEPKGDTVWTLADVSPDDGPVAAIAIAGKNPAITIFHAPSPENG